MYVNAFIILRDKKSSFSCSTFSLIRSALPEFQQFKILASHKHIETYGSNVHKYQANFFSVIIITYMNMNLEFTVHTGHMDMEWTWTGSF